MIPTCCKVSGLSSLPGYLLLLLGTSRFYPIVVQDHKLRMTIGNGSYFDHICWIVIEMSSRL